jgi:hypothetical protein
MKLEKYINNKNIHILCDEVAQILTNTDQNFVVKYRQNTDGTFEIQINEEDFFISDSPEVIYGYLLSMKGFLKDAFNKEN